MSHSFPLLHQLVLSFCSLQLDCYMNYLTISLPTLLFLFAVVTNSAQIICVYISLYTWQFL